MRNLLALICFICLAIEANCFYYGTNYLINQNVDTYPKRETYDQITDDLNESIDLSRRENTEQEYEETASDDNTAGYYANNPDYQRYFGRVVNAYEVPVVRNIMAKINDEAQLVQHNFFDIPDSPVENKEKRFLKALWEKIKPKKTTTKKPGMKQESHVDEDHSNDDFMDAIEDLPRPTTPASGFGKSNGMRVEDAKLSSSMLDDPFYKLKSHCMFTYDNLCMQKRKDMLDLVVKCDSLQKTQKIEACSDVLSIYCYVYLTRDMKTCLGRSYDLYIPGQKKYTNGGGGASSGTTQSTRKNQVYTPATTTTTTTTTRRPTTTTTTTTTTRKAAITPSYPPLKPNTGLVNPFNGPVKSVPKDPEELKRIGNYCLKTKQRDQNCDKMLQLLKDKFKYCEKMPKSDADCQSFKIDFCQAFPSFPCCADALAGRTCSGKKNT